jgi:hypothetical protein
MRSRAHTIATLVTLALAAVACGKDGAPWQVGGDHVGPVARRAVSTTTITAANTRIADQGRPIGMTDESRYHYGFPRQQSMIEWRTMARGDITNLDKRLDILEHRLANAPTDVEDRLIGEVREARGQRDALADDVTELESASQADWGTRRAQLDSDWDALLTRVDAIGEQIPAP